MRQSVPWYIGLRYIRSKRRNGFIGLVSLFALLGMTLGVFALIVVLSVMNGLDHELKARILKVVPHGFVAGRPALRDWPALAERIRGTPNLLASAPYIAGKGLITYAATARPLQLQGVDPHYERGVSRIAESMVVGRLEDLRPGHYGVVLGNIVARNLGVIPGDKVSITLPRVSVTPAGVFPRSKRFIVVGVFEAGAQVDQTLALMHVADAQKLFRLPGQVQGLRLRFDDIYLAPQRVQALLTALGPDYAGKDWSQTQGSLFNAVKMEKTVVGLMLGVIIAVAAFNIITSLIMMVAEKRGDIAVLRTLGLEKGGIVKIFMVQGTVMGAVGVVAGGVSGIFVAHHLADISDYLERLTHTRVFDPNVYFVDYLPSLWQLQDTLWICGFALVISFLATIYPAYRAAQIEPAEALRYDL